MTIYNDDATIVAGASSVQGRDPAFDQRHHQKKLQEGLAKLASGVVARVKVISALDQISTYDSDEATAVEMDCWAFENSLPSRR